MKVLINGCSHVEGTGLPGAGFGETRKLTWPNYVYANHLVTNIAEAGSSNDKICRTTLEELGKKSYDLIYIQWSIFERIELEIPVCGKYGIENPRQCVHSMDAVSLNHIGFLHEVAKSIFLKQFDTQWFIDYNLSQMVVLQNWLQMRNCNYIFVMTDFPIEVWKNSRAKLLDKTKIIDLSWFDFCQKGGFRKVDSAHYEHSAHLKFADYVKNQIIKQGISL